MNEIDIKQKNHNFLKLDRSD